MLLVVEEAEEGMERTTMSPAITPPPAANKDSLLCPGYPSCTEELHSTYHPHRRGEAPHTRGACLHLSSGIVGRRGSRELIFGSSVPPSRGDGGAPATRAPHGHYSSDSRGRYGTRRGRLGGERGGGRGAWRRQWRWTAMHEVEEGSNPPPRARTPRPRCVIV